MSEHDREWVGAVTALVHEVHPHSVEVSKVVLESVELTLLLAPVELAGPVREQRAQILGVDSGFQAGGVRAVRPASSLDPVEQVG